MDVQFVILLFACFTFNWIIALPVTQNDEKESDNEVESIDGDEIDLTHLENTMYGFESEETGKKVAMWHEGDAVNPEELGEYAEGDILVPGISSRSGLRSKRYLWPGGIIPYMISPVFDQAEHALIIKAMKEIEQKTCLVFIPRTGESAYVRIKSENTGCWSPVGNSRTRTDINLQRPSCVAKIGTVQHEILHSIGMVHEQSRDDRDQYVYIQRQNIKSGSEVNFEKYSSKIINNFGKSYDYGSVMHYSPYAFSKNGQPTIIPMDNDRNSQGDKNRIMGQRDGLSPIDIEKINLMYDCYNRK